MPPVAPVTRATWPCKRRDFEMGLHGMNLLRLSDDSDTRSSPSHLHTAASRMCCNRMSFGIAPKSGMPSPIRTGTRVIDEALNQSCPEKLLDRDAPIDIGVFESPRSQIGDDLSGSARHLFDQSTADSGEIKMARAQNDDLFVAVGPFRKGENDLVRSAADYENIDAGDELVVAMGFASVSRQEIEGVVEAGDEAVDAGADEDRGEHGTVSSYLERKAFRNGKSRAKSLVPKIKIPILLRLEREKRMGRTLESA